MIKKHQVHYKGMSKDVASDLQSEQYFDAKNIRILSTDQKSSFAVTNEVGNELIFSIPTPIFDFENTKIRYTVGTVEKTISYATETSVVPRCELESNYVDISQNPDIAYTSGTQIIIGTKELRDSALIVTTDDNGWDCFWELTDLIDGNFDLNLLYMGNLGLSKNNLVQVLYNYENSIIQKIYFVDGKHQLRFFNIRQSVDNGDSKNLIDISSSIIDVVSTFTLSQPIVNGVISGGGHTAGMVQYAYGLYVLNGAQTTVSPVSILTSIDKGENLGGGEVNENLGRSVEITVEDIDPKFTHIKLYSIKYTSYNELPEISIVADKEVDNFTSFKFTDVGGAQDTISLEEFIFLGSSPVVPKHIVTKDNRLFPINIKQSNFDVDIDCRAYSYSAGQTAIVMENVYLDQYGTIMGVYTTVPGDFNIPVRHDAINRDYDTYMYKSDGTSYGASGKYVEIEITQTAMSEDDAEELQFLKDRELYRYGIKFYNRRGQTSDPKWISDLRTPEGNLAGTYNQLKVNLTAEFYTWLADDSNFDSEDDKPTGYKVIRADRTLNDQTIYAQGFINPMVANYVTTNKALSLADRKAAVNSNESDIIPSMTRMFETMIPFQNCKDYYELAFNSSGNLTRNNTVEGFVSLSDDYRAQNFQHNRLMQFYSPEVTFRDNQIDSSYFLKVLGIMQQDDVHNWSTETNPINATTDVEIKFTNGITSSTPGVNSAEIKGSAGWVSDLSFYGPTNHKNNHATHQVHRSFNGAFHKSSGDHILYDMYGTPELTQEGADFKPYNNDYQLRYSNNLKTMLIDKWAKSKDVREDADVQIRGCNTIGAKCITFAEGPDEIDYNVDSRRSIEQMYGDTSLNVPDGVLLTEFTKNVQEMYIGNIYGGMSYEAKSNASYIEIGTFANIADDVSIVSPGDTFVGPFTFSKMTKDNLENTSQEWNLVSEIVTIRCETTVDLKNRNDLSLGAWDNRWQPKMEEYQKYNDVYSQQPTLIKAIDDGFKFKKIQEFDGRLMTTKIKVPGESIDSWTDFLENDTMDLDGKYGPINAVVNLMDEVFCLQDTAVVHIAINPRVQVPGSDGVGLELGTGGILHDYTYKSTTVGCINKWGVVKTENSFYFVDLINQAIMTFDGSKVGRLSDSKGFHHEFVNRMNHNELKADNSVLGAGVSLGYNPVNADVYFSFLQSTDPFTLAFNEKIGEFVSFYDYVPAWYINKGSVLITSNPSHTQMWEHFKGTPNHFYGTHYKSTITLQVAPDGNEIILNGASYKRELTDSNGNEILLEGLTGVRVYNDYQDSGVVSLVIRQNVFKKFRNWTVQFPRQSGSRDRVRSAWGFAEFSFENTNGNKLILHDISIFYTQH